MLSYLIPACSYAIQGYKDLCYELHILKPLDPQGTYQRVLGKDSKEYKESSSDKAIEQQMKAFLQERGVRSDVKFLQGQGFEAHGTNFFTKYDTVVFFPDSNLESPETSAVTRFFIKREVAHIKYNRNAMVNFLPAICAIFSAHICRVNARSDLEAILIGLSVARLAQSALFKLFNVLADKFALDYGTIDELEAAKKQVEYLDKHDGCVLSSTKKWGLTDCLKIMNIGLKGLFYERKISQFTNRIARLRRAAGTQPQQGLLS